MAPPSSVKPHSHRPLTGWSARVVEYMSARVNMGVSNPIKFDDLEALQDNLYQPISRA